eukprot:Sspe_Gene.30809::Locus_15221_Transcript_1_1_Confidence_1.000_Length_2179::g.30809::m.30809
MTTESPMTNPLERHLGANLVFGRGRQRIDESPTSFPSLTFSPLIVESPMTNLGGTVKGLSFSARTVGDDISITPILETPNADPPDAAAIMDDWIHLQTEPELMGRIIKELGLRTAIVDELRRGGLSSDLTGERTAELLSQVLDRPEIQSFIVGYARETGILHQSDRESMRTNSSETLGKSPPGDQRIELRGRSRTNSPAASQKQDSLAGSTATQPISPESSPSPLLPGSMSDADFKEQQQLLKDVRTHVSMLRERETIDMQQPEMYEGRMQPEAVSQEKGLENPPGHNNCFLNVVLQALWHAEPFRSNFLRDFNMHTCTEKFAADSCLYCAIHTLFMQYKFSSHQHLPPFLVRQILSRVFSEEGRFRLGAMDDAAECLEAILYTLHLCVNDQRDTCRPPCFVHRTFGLNIMERGMCLSCKGVNEPFLYSATVLYTPAGLIQGQCPKVNHTKCTSFEKCLNFHLRGIPKECETCKGKTTPAEPYLLDIPEVLVLGVAWEQDGSELEDGIPLEVIQQFTSQLPTQLNVSDAFQVPGVSVTKMAPEVKQAVLKGKPSKPHHSTSVVSSTLFTIVCFYGKHYTCYCYKRGLDKWLYFDDSHVRVVGSFQDVQSTIVKSRQQPLLLFYEVGEVHKRTKASACSVM